MAKEPNPPISKTSQSNDGRKRKPRAAATARQSRPINFIPNEKQQAPPPFSTQKMFVFDRPQPAGRVQLELPDSALQDVLAQRQLAVTHLYRTLDAMQSDLKDFFPKLSDTLPTTADGILLNPDGTPAAGVAVEAQQPDYGDDKNATAAFAKIGWTFPVAVTDARGAFRLNLPSVQIPPSGLQLNIRGANAVLKPNPIDRVRLLGGRLGLIALNQPLVPLPQESVVAQLKEIQADILATTKDDVVNRPDQFATPPQQMTIGEGDCARLFRSNNGVIDSFRYSTLIRLIEPQMNIWQPLFRIALNQQRFVPFALPEANDALWRVVDPQNAISKLQALGHLTLVNRTPISQPIDVTAFHNQIEVSPVALPKASTLGLGYTVDLQQVWIPAGMSLGDLVYSLPLAPGEQQRIAIEESTKTLTDRTIETFSVDELQTFRETEDSSALAVFQSAFDEAARGGSQMQSSSKTGSVAAEASTGIIGAIFGGGGVSGGYSSSSSSGSTSSWQNTSRDFTSNAAQNMHSALNRVAAASRRGSQTSIRVASETEHTQVTTRIVTNHNKNHALTMQWWQVLRHFTVTSEVDDVQMVCFVPLELIQFLPEGQPFSLPGMPGEKGGPNLFGATPRQFLLNRYAMVLRYWDVIMPFFRRNAEYAYGMRALRDFAANPEAVPESSKLQQDVMHFVITGTFMPFEDVFVSIVTKSGGALGPVKLTLTTLPNPVIDVTTQEQFTSSDDLLGALKKARLNTAVTATLEASIPLPNWIARSDIARFDLSRRYNSLTYRMKLPAGALGDALNFLDIIQKQTVSFSPSFLEQQLGGPIPTGATAKPVGDPTNFLPPHAFSAGDQMPGRLPLPALRVAPILSFADLLRIEAVFHHIVRNTVFYSKAVWAALSDEERAILLERFTIGVPAGGIQTADQEVPLLNCVANRVLGFFGNALIMPFGIPPDVAKRMGVTSRDIQDALLRFHRQAFQAPRSSITLPAHGTLGEAVLGCCDSAEKIDLTRFWNWQDSPSDQADAIPTNVFAPPQPIPAATAPGAGGGSGVGGGAGSSGSIISINSPPATTPSSALVEALIKQSPDLAKELNLTGLDTLQKQIATDTQSAGSGRKEALDSVTNIQLQAMKSAEGMVKSVADAAGKVGAAALGVPPVGGGGDGKDAGGGNGKKKNDGGGDGGGNN